MKERQCRKEEGIIEKRNERKTMQKVKGRKNNRKEK